MRTTEQNRCLLFFGFGRYEVAFETFTRHPAARLAEQADPIPTLALLLRFLRHQRGPDLALQRVSTEADVL